MKPKKTVSKIIPANDDHISFNWEIIHKSADFSELVLRAKVWGGWLVRYHTNDVRIGAADTMTFVPDGEYKWGV